jgi:hypothetical protein
MRLKMMVGKVLEEDVQAIGPIGRFLPERFEHGSLATLSSDS